MTSLRTCVLRAGSLALFLGLLPVAGCEREPAGGSVPAGSGGAHLDLARRAPTWWERDDGGRWSRIEPSAELPIQSRWRIDGPLEKLAQSDTLDLVAVGRAGGRLLAELPPLAPTDVSALRLTYAGTSGGPLRLAWRHGQEEAFTHGLDAVVVEGGGRWQEVVLPLGAPFRAKDRIAEIALLLPADEVGTVRVHSSQLLLRQPPPFAPPKLELDAQLREVMAMGPDRAVEWTCTLPTQPLLIFDYACAPPSWIVRGDGSVFRAAVLEGNQESEVWIDALDAYADPGDREWKTAQVDLSRWAGREVRVRIEALASAPAHGIFPDRRDVRGDAPLLSAPRIVSTTQPPRRILMIVIDTLRRDGLGVYGHEGGVSPNLDAWAQRGRVFDRAWAPAPWTHPSTASFLSGWLPSRHGLGMGAEAGSPVRLDPETPWLPLALRGAGWATAAVSNNIIVSPDEGFARGFDQFDMRAFPRDQIYGGQRVTHAALEWLEGHGELPYFLYLHYFDPHDRYQAPPPFTRQFVGGRLRRKLNQSGIAGGRPNFLRDGVADPTRQLRVAPDQLRYLRALYDGEVAYVDHWIGILLDRMQAEGWLENTLVVITSDHGEEFFEHGFFKHGHSLHEELLRVPLVLIDPRETEPGRRIGAPVSLLDLPSTLLGFAGLEPFAPDVDLLAGPLPLSRLVLAENRSRGLAPELGYQRTAVRWPFKLMENVDLDTQVLYDLASDPGEQRPLDAAPTAAADSLRAALEAIEGPSAIAEDASLPPDPALIEKMKAMGYVH